MSILNNDWDLVLRSLPLDGYYPCGINLFEYHTEHTSEESATFFSIGKCWKFRANQGIYLTSILTKRHL